MDESDVKSLNDREPREWRFHVTQGAVSIHECTLTFSGLAGIHHLCLGAGWTFDLTHGVGGAEQLHLQGMSTGYRVVAKGSVLTLTEAAQGTVISMKAGRGPHKLVFDDGFVRMSDLWRNVTQASALSRLTGADAVLDSALVVSYVHVRNDATFQREAHSLPDGALLKIAGLDRVESVFGPSPSSPVCLEGTFPDYGVTIQGAVVSLDRQWRGRFEGVYLVGDSQVAFADGEVSAEELRHLLQARNRAPSEGDAAAADPDRPKATSVTVSVDPLTSSFESWFVGLSGGGLLSGVYVGQVLEATVSFSEVVFVSGIPQVRLRIGDMERIAHYSGCSGGDTLRFVYVVTEDDVLEAARRELDESVERHRGVRLDVEVGELLFNGATVQSMSDLLCQDIAMAEDRSRVGKCPASAEHGRLFQLRTGFRFKLDVDLDELEQEGDPVSGSLHPAQV